MIILISENENKEFDSFINKIMFRISKNVWFHPLRSISHFIHNEKDAYGEHKFLIIMSSSKEDLGYEITRYNKCSLMPKNLTLLNKKHKIQKSKRLETT